MANEKFEPSPEITEVEVRLECLRLATEFGPEYERKDPISVIVKSNFFMILYFLQCSNYYFL